MKRLNFLISTFISTVLLINLTLSIGYARSDISSVGSNRIFSSSQSAPQELAYEYLNSVMDKYNNTFDVYTDANAGGNHYISSGWMGDWQDISFDGDSTGTTPHSGLTSISVDYSAQATQGNQWSGIYWQQPENNWGTVNGGYDLSGDTKLTFWAKKGEQSDPWVDFKVGGINRIPFNDPSKPYKDTFGISTGPVKLTADWKKYTIPLNKDYFDIYRDQHTAYIPSGWMGNWRDITFDDKYNVDPYSGRTAIRINYSAATSGWAGIYWQNPENNWGDIPGGFNLTGFEKIKFWAKGEKGDERIEFYALGINPYKPYGDSNAKVSLGYITLTNAWQQYEIDLTGKNLSRVIGAFGWVTNRSNNPNGATFYLDDIRYERPLTDNDLSKILGGFSFTVNKDGNPNGTSFYLDDIQYDKSRPESLRLLNSFETENNSEAALANTAYTYDNALAMLSYIARGTPDDWRRAKIIADTLIYAQNHDRDYSDGRIRNAYRSGDIAETPDGPALLPGWWDDTQNKWLEDKEAISSSTGNIAWAMIALLAYYEKQGGQAYLTPVEQMGEWIEQNMRDDINSNGGYMGGYLGWKEDAVKQTWKSTEHNIDLYVAFSRLYQTTGDSKWSERANHAKKFVETMWNDESGYFWTGTLLNGVTINKSNIPVDIQAWAVLAFPKNSEYRRGLDWAETNAVSICSQHNCPNYPLNSVDFKGFDFNNDTDGIWPEGTGQMVTAYKITSQIDKANTYLEELRRIQSSANNNNGKGIVAACHDGVTTGFNWQYFNRLHVGATSWFLFAEQGYNPYYSPEPSWTNNLNDTTSPVGSVSINNRVAFTNLTNVILSLSATDTGSGIDKMRFKNGGGSWSGWVNYTTTKNWTLTSGNGTKKVIVQFKDRAGNISVEISDTILLDKTSKLSLAASPRSIRRGGRVTLRGQLRNRTGRGIAGKRVIIRANGRRVGTARTNSSGHYSFRHRPDRTTHYTASFPGDSSYTQTISRPVRVTVRRR